MEKILQMNRFVAVLEFRLSGSSGENGDAQLVTALYTRDMMAPLSFINENTRVHGRSPALTHCLALYSILSL